MSDAMVRGYASLPFSQALVEEYSGVTSSDGAQSAQLNGNPTQLAYLPVDRMTAFSRLSRFGMTFKPLTESLGQGVLTSYLAAFPVRTSHQQDEAQALTEPDPECGHTWQELLAKYDQDSSTWKTPQCSLLEDSIGFLGTWPRWGLMRDGVSYRQQTLVPRIKEIGSGLWATPSASDGQRGGTITDKMTGQSLTQMVNTPAKWPTPAARDGKPTNTLETLMDGRFVDQLANRVKMVETNLWTTPCSRDWKGKTISKNHPEGFNKSLANDVIKFPTPQASDCRDRGNMSNPSIQRRAEKGKQLNLSMVAHPTSGQLNPTWVEWLMGWPLGWTDLKPLEMDKFQQWRQQHGIY
jgi:hypothetical protein